MEQYHDNFRNFLIAATAATPYIGGPLSFLLDKYVPSAAERKRNEFLTQLSFDIQSIENKISIENMNTPEFQSIFIKLLKASFEEYRKEKIVSFRNIIVNILTNDQTQNFNEIEFFARLALNLLPDEIKILNVFYQLDSKKTLLDISDTNENRRDIYCIIEKLWGKNDKEYIQALIFDCMRYVLISGSVAQKRSHGKDGIFLTPLGEKFVNYIFSPIEGVFFENE